VRFDILLEIATEWVGPLLVEAGGLNRVFRSVSESRSWVNRDLTLEFRSLVKSAGECLSSDQIAGNQYKDIILMNNYHFSVLYSLRKTLLTMPKVSRHGTSCFKAISPQVLMQARSAVVRNGLEAVSTSYGAVHRPLTTS
jgi:hypothetical protein